MGERGEMSVEGRKLGGRYEIISRIGGGGMAVVYKARDVLLNRYVAIKVLNESLSNDSEFIRRFSREAQAAASLSHPNVVGVYDVGQEDYTHYIVMEYIEGPTLKEYIQQYSPLTAEEIVSIASQICDALAHAHENQIVHRDVKPHNILLSYNGRAKVTDFGIARRLYIFNDYTSGFSDGIRSLFFSGTGPRRSDRGEIGHLLPRSGPL